MLKIAENQSEMMESLFNTNGAHNMNTIKQYRISNGLSMSALADMLGVTTGAVSRWESGDRKVPQIAVKLIEKMDCIEQLWDDLEQASKLIETLRRES